MDETRRLFLTTTVAALGVAATQNLGHPEDREQEHSHEKVDLEETIIATRLTERVGIKHPIVCAPMGYVAGGALAAAVSRAGGLGLVGGGSAGTFGGLDLEAELARVKSSKFGVGFITWALARAPEMLTNALRYKPYCVFLSFGDPRPFATQIRDAGAALNCQVQFLSQLDAALEAGAAAVVVQRNEAGGHGATNRSTFPFVPEAADYLKRHSPATLLIAAGGIADGRGLAAALIPRCRWGSSWDAPLGVGGSPHSKSSHRQGDRQERRFDHSDESARCAARHSLAEGILIAHIKEQID